MNYWILLCNPNKWFGEGSFENAKVNEELKNLDVESWTANNEKVFQSIQKGDKCLIKVGQDERSEKVRTLPNGQIVEKLQPGIYALCEIIPNDNGEVYWEDENGDHRVRVKITKNLFQEGHIIEENKARELLNVDKNYYDVQGSTKISEKAYKNIENYIKNNFEGTLMSKQNVALDQILYGPPGTGKTYDVIYRAVALIENKNLDELYQEGFQVVKQRFDEYRQQGQVEFITFHQSYSYEDFIEGLKAETDEDGNVHYKIEDGIFKKISKKAQKSDNFDDIYEKFLESFDDNGEKILKTKRGNIFKIKINSNRNLTLITGQELKSQGTITKESLRDNSYKYWKSYTEPIIQELKELGLKTVDNSDKNYVLIIDEINRGNISKIFGELITLIEKDKRLCNKEAMEVTLPYSKESFGVPKNLSIIGTMNTADRSIALLDTALRRRFEFVEMMPKYDKLSQDIEGIDLQEMLRTMNERIEYLYNRDHTIGHAYLMNISSFEDLQEVFKNKIIPLLAEYFYDDWEKIRLVLADNQIKNENYHFVVKKESDVQSLFGDIDNEIPEEKAFYEINEKAFDDPKSFIKIYDPSVINE